MTNGAARYALQPDKTAMPHQLVPNLVLLQEEFVEVCVALSHRQQRSRRIVGAYIIAPCIFEKIRLSGSWLDVSLQLVL
jgi:hypothetical protein